MTTKELKALIEQFEDKDEIEFCAATSEGNGYSDEIFLGKVTQKQKKVKVSKRSNYTLVAKLSNT